MDENLILLEAAGLGLVLAGLDAEALSLGTSIKELLLQVTVAGELDVESLYLLLLQVQVSSD